MSAINTNSLTSEQVTEQIAKMRQEQELLTLQTEATTLRRQLLAQEMALSQAPYYASQPQHLMEAWGDPIDPYDYAKNEPYGQYPQAPYLGEGNRRNGRLRPVFDNENDLRLTQQLGDWLATAFPAGKAALNGLCNHIFKKSGFTYAAAASKKANPPEAMVEAVDRVLQKFLDVNDWVNAREVEAYRRACKHGEAIITIWPGTECPLVRFAEPEYLTEPANPGEWHKEDGCWLFGVHTHKDDIERVLGYHFKWDDLGQETQYLPASQVLHIKRNVDSTIKRGLSDYYPITEHLPNGDKLLKNTSVNAAVVSAIAYLRQHAEGTTKSQVQDLRDTQARGVTTTVSAAGTQTRYIGRTPPGSVFDIPKGMEYVNPPLSAASAAQGFMAIHQAVLRMVGTNWHMPEYMVSGDASNNNFASALVAESPFVIYCEREQDFNRRNDRKLLWKVLKIAHQCGQLGGYSWEEIERQIEIKIDAPIVASREPDKETARRKILSDEGILSAKTWASEEGYDYEAEQDLGAKKAAKPGFDENGMPFPKPGMPGAKPADPSQIPDADFEAMMSESAKDGDGDGLINDGTANEQAISGNTTGTEDGDPKAKWKALKKRQARELAAAEKEYDKYSNLDADAEKFAEKNSSIYEKALDKEQDRLERKGVDGQKAYDQAYKNVAAKFGMDPNSRAEGGLGSDHQAYFDKMKQGFIDANKASYEKKAKDAGDAIDALEFKHADEIDQFHAWRKGQKKQAKAKKPVMESRLHEAAKLIWGDYPGDKPKVA